MGKLSATKVIGAKPKEREYSLGDGGGLFLRVRPNGAKCWMFHYQTPADKLNGRRSKISIGEFPAISLAEARQIGESHRGRLINGGIDPKAWKAQQQEQERQQLQADQNTFDRMAMAYIETRRSSWSVRHASDVESKFKLHVFPHIGHMPVAGIRAPDAIKALKPLESRGVFETLQRIATQIIAVMTYCVNCGLIHANPCAGIKQVFPRPISKPQPAVTPKELPELLAAISRANVEYQTRGVLLWCLHTMTRPNEAVTARWDDIDLIAGTWTVRPEQLKRKVQGKIDGPPHIIPLTDQTRAMLDELRPISGRGVYVFPGRSRPATTHASVQAANQALKRMGYLHRQVTHGLRSIGSTALNEAGFSPDAIEAALSHQVAGKVRSAYNRSNYLEQRRELMAWWSSLIERACKGEAVGPQILARQRLHRGSN